MPIDPAKPFDLRYRVDPTWAEERLDRFVKAMIPAMSRTKIQRYIAEGRVEVNGTVRPANWRVHRDDIVLLRCHEPSEGADIAQRIPIEILYEDEDLLLVNKQPGLLVHPVALHRHDTLLNALYWRYKDILPPDQNIELVNRIDRYTSGVVVLTKSREAKQILQEQFEARLPQKTYLALAQGLVKDKEGMIDLPLGPALSRTDRCKIGVRYDEKGKPSQTFYRVLERFPRPELPSGGVTLLRIEPYTGRQHQIRVHMAEIGHPLVCDDRYGDPRELVAIPPPSPTPERHLNEGSPPPRLARYALHAESIAFSHPRTRHPLIISAPLANDMATMLEALRAGWKVCLEAIASRACKEEKRIEEEEDSTDESLGDSPAIQEQFHREEPSCHRKKGGHPLPL